MKSWGNGLSCVSLFSGQESQHFAREFVGEAEPRFRPRVEIDSFFVEPDRSRLSPTILRPRKIISRMYGHASAWLNGVVVQRQALARCALGAFQGIRESVQRSLVGRKDQRMIQQWGIFRGASRHLPCRRFLPKFQSSTPLFAPSFIQIEN